MDVETAAFFSREGVVAMALLLVALGKTVDWLLLKRHKVRMLARMTAFGDYLRELPFRQVQIDLVRGLLNFLTAVSVPWSLRRHPLVTGKADDDLEVSEIFAVIWAAMSRPLQFLLGVVLLLLWAFGGLDFRYGSLLGVLGIALLLRSAFWLLHMAALGHELEPDPGKVLPPFMVWAQNSRLLGLLDAVGIRLLLISFALTVLALEIGLAYWEAPQASRWFTVEDSLVAPSAPLTLALINLPFDALAIIITIALLKFALRREASISLTALTDSLLTAVIALALFAVLLIDFTAAPETWLPAVEAAISNLLRIFTLGGSKTDALFPLYPLLFTPFAPIAFYLLLPILIAVVARPLLRIAAHICTAFGEKANSPFLQIAIGLSLLIGLVKGLSEWQWFSDRVAALLS